jgi:hypothetical protein
VTTGRAQILERIGEYQRATDAYRQVAAASDALPRPRRIMRPGRTRSPPPPRRSKGLMTPAPPCEADAPGKRV